jgi:hypothetical protein
MKKNKLIFIAVTATTCVSVAFMFLFNNESLYKPRAQKNNALEKEEQQTFSEAAKWLFNIQKNQITGLIDPSDVLRARDDFERMRSMKSANAALGLEWTELGPDNVGGRTRAILFDNHTPNKMFAGSVTGGLFVSTNNGTNWTPLAGFGQQPILGVSCITQAPNGDIYAGTGEDMGVAFLGNNGGFGEPNFIGGGIYKSTDDGQTFILLDSTRCTANTSVNSNQAAFIGVNNIAADPTNSNRIYAATRYGLEITDDGGLTWKRGLSGANTNSKCTDVDVASDHTVLVGALGKLYRSETGDAGTFTLISGGTSGLPLTGLGRAEFAISPTDPNYMYASIVKSSSDDLLGIYQSVDKGLTWKTIGNGGSSQFQPLGNQGSYANSLAVFPFDKTKIIVAGLDAYIWKQSSLSVPGVGQWDQSSFWNIESPSFPRHIHADIHTIKFNPANPNTCYIGCDGGIYRGYDSGSNGMVYQAMNKGYNVTQFYCVGFAGDDPAALAFAGGAQDNGTQYVSGHGNSTKTAQEINGGDGNDCDISFLNPNVSFSTVYSGALARHSSKGGGGSDFYSANATRYLAANGASFITPIALYETKSSINSPDSVKFINQPSSQILGTGNGINKHFTGYLNLPQFSATPMPGSVTIKSGVQNISDDGAGNLIGNVDVSKSNTIDLATGYFDFYFNSAPATAAVVLLKFNVTYSSGSKIIIPRSDYAYPLNYICTSQINPGDIVKMYDSVQAKFAVGFTGAVYMTKGALDFSGAKTWMKIGTVAGTVENLSWSGDGNNLYVGTDGGVLYRFSNLAGVVDSLNGDIGASPLNTHCIVVKTQIAKFTGRFITDIAVDPTNTNNVAVSLGNYGNTTYVYYSTTAGTCASSTSTANFSAKQGTGISRLPSMPIYSVLIEKDPASTSNRVILGTEHGIYSTDDITAATPVWSVDNGSSGPMPNVPVFKLRQQNRPGTDVYNPYVIYAGTHGRGAWKCETYKGAVHVGINEPIGSLKTNSDAHLSLYPNPVREECTVAFNLNSTTDVVISIFNLQGKLIKSVKYGKLNAGEQKVVFNADELLNGTYILSLDGNTTHATSKFIVMK